MNCESPDIFQVSFTSKVMQKLSTTKQLLPSNRTDFIVSDQSGTIKLTLWGEPAQILENSSLKTLQ